VPTEYPSISAAISAAKPGSRILVRPGRYQESLIINKQLEISGEGLATRIIIESINSSCLQMQTDKAIVRGLTLRTRTNLEEEKYYAVDISQGSLILEDCDITSDSSACVSVHGASTNPIIRNCNIHDGKQSGILIQDSAKGEIVGCTIKANALFGISVLSGGNPYIHKCSILQGHSSGVFVSENGSGKVEECDISNNDNGIRIRKNSKLVVEHCKINYNEAWGLEIKSESKCVLQNCDLRHNKQGSSFVEENCIVQRSENIE
jgi:parallel beta-helix repeat protein